MTKNQTGFTLPELMVTLIMTSVLVTLIMFFTFSYWQYSYILQADQYTFTQRLDAGDYLRDTLGSSSGIITQNSIPDTHTGKPDTSISNGLYWVPIHAVPGNVAMSSSGTYTPLMYFKGLSVDKTNAVIMNGSQPYEDEYILYLYNLTNSLQLRTLANPNAVNNKVTTSCPVSTATTNCPSDKILISNIKSIDRRFFSRSGNLIDWTSLYDSSLGTYVGPDNPTVETIELTLNVSTKAVFQTSNTTKNSTVIRITLRNT